MMMLRITDLGDNTWNLEQSVSNQQLCSAWSPFSSRGPPQESVAERRAKMSFSALSFLPSFSSLFFDISCFSFYGRYKVV